MHDLELEERKNVNEKDESYSLLSPFVYRDGQFTLEDDNIKKASYRTINALLLKGVLTDFDMDILLLIYRFKYLNRHNIEIYLSKDQEALINLKKRRALYVDKGLLHRYYLSYQVDEKTKALCRMSYIYTPTRGLVSYVKKSRKIDVDISAYCVLEGLENMFMCLCINQAFIYAIKGNMTLEKMNMKVYLEGIGQSVNIWGVVSLEAIEDKMVNFIFEPIRRFPGWIKKLEERMILIAQLLEDEKSFMKYRGMGLLLICETVLDCKLCFLRCLRCILCITAS